MVYESLRNELNYRYSLNDITAVYAIRASEHNPWVIDRLQLINAYYDSLPRVLIIDFGSSDIYADQINNICNRVGFEYKFINDSGVFSPGIARNIGFSFVQTPLVIFNDIDCFSSPDFFESLVKASNDFELSKYFDRMINLPVYHLTESATSNIEKYLTKDKNLISKLFVNSLFSERQTCCDFIAPYSNVFLCRTDLFSYIGGYDERFRGHGSEDFEFLIRYSIYSGRYPQPQEFDKDFYSPIRDSFYKDLKRYKGFRRLFEALSFEAETYGLKVAHLFHSKPEEMSWFKKNDWKRETFSTSVTQYLNNKKNLLNLDWIPREKKLLVLVNHDDHLNFIYVLRNAGFKIEYLDLTNKQNQIDLIKKIDHGYYDAVCMFNPYMKSHVDLYLYFSYAKNNGVKTIVIERGALPDSWYYADDMAYIDPNYDDLDINSVEIENQLKIDDYFEMIRKGTFTLEANGNYSETYYKYRLLLSISNKKKFFVPLQLSDDSAVTKFVGELNTYEIFLVDLKKMISDNKNVIFIIKKHPLSNTDNLLSELTSELHDNLFICDDSDNVHALIETADATLCYNSGVGLLALMHKKPVFTVGRSFYTKNNLKLAIPISLPSDAIDKFNQLNGEYSTDIHKFIHWLVEKKYSFYKSTSVIKDFGDRKSHGYINSKFYKFNYENFKIASLNINFDYPFSLMSYGSAKLDIKVGIDQQLKDTGNKIKTLDFVESQLITKEIKATESRIIMKKISKLLNNPKSFFADSKFPLLKRFSSIF